MTEQQMLDLQVGDIVCDCNYRHLRVVAITEDLYIPGWMIRPFFILPSKAVYWVEDHWPRFLMKIGDKDLELSNGSHCSAISCCHVSYHAPFYDTTCAIIDK